MDVTLHRRHERPASRLRPRTVLTGPMGVLTASCVLSVGLLAAVSDLVTRLG